MLLLGIVILILIGHRGFFSTATGRYPYPKLTISHAELLTVCHENCPSVKFRDELCSRRDNSSSWAGDQAKDVITILLK